MGGGGGGVGGGLVADVKTRIAGRIFAGKQPPQHRRAASIGGSGGDAGLISNDGGETEWEIDDRGK